MINAGLLKQKGRLSFIGSYFTNLENITICQLEKARRSIKAAVAWINFNHYGHIFEKLLNRGVKINILLNNDSTNQRYINNIQHLNSIGADIRLVNFAGIMHHKFCVIDEHICMFGSFNWTQSADIRNIEDLNICDEIKFVNNYLLEFEALWNLSKTDIHLLRYPSCCSNCKNPIINILFMELEGYSQTKIDVLQQCACEQKIVYTDYYDACVYNNYIATIHLYDEEITAVYESGDESTYHQLLAQQDFAIANYLSLVRANRMGMPIIHAVGVKSCKWLDKHSTEYIYEIIWKERGTSSYIRDKYAIYTEQTTV